MEPMKFVCWAVALVDSSTARAGRNATECRILRVFVMGFMGSTSVRDKLHLTAGPAGVTTRDGPVVGAFHMVCAPALSKRDTERIRNGRECEGSKIQHVDLTRCRRSVGLSRVLSPHDRLR